MLDKLSKNDKKIVQALVTYPSLTDHEISNRTNIKQSTVTSIRNRLFKEGFLKTVNRPDLGAIGCRIMCLLHGDFNPLTSAVVRDKTAAITKFDYVVMRISSDRERVSLACAPDFVDIKRWIDYAEKNFGKRGFLSPKGNSYIYFPFELSTVVRFFDYTLLLSHTLGIKEGKQDVLSFSTKKPTQLTKKERMVYSVLVENPQSSDNNIAKKLSLPRQTVNLMHRKFISQGILKERNVPNLHKLGFELVVFTDLRLNPTKTLDKEGLAKALGDPWHYFIASCGLETGMLSAYRNFKEFRQQHNKLIDSLFQNNIILQNPVIRIFSLEDIPYFISSRYAPLVKTMLKV